jgi:ABC-type sulfate/molybdate transport systems ATPase subunit
VSDPLLHVEQLAVARGRRTVLDDVDLEVLRAETLAVLGPNGAGKSTLLAAIAGGLPLQRGSVRVDGRVAAALQAPALASRTALANVELALSWWGVRRSASRRRRARAALDAFGVGHLGDRHARTLSGGEQRRVHLARALALDADLLLLDEPFAGLDPVARADLLYAAAPLLRSDERATIVVVHDRAEARALADRVLVILDGRVRGDGPPSAVFEAPATEDVARFVGYEGVIDDGGCRRLLRVGDVVVDPHGPMRGVVERAVPVEYGVRLDVRVDGGHLVVHAPEPGAPVGSEIGLTVTGGVTFPSATPRAATDSLT